MALSKLHDGSRAGEDVWHATSLVLPMVYPGEAFSDPSVFNDMKPSATSYTKKFFKCTANDLFKMTLFKPK